MKRATLEIIDPNLVIKPPIVGTYCVKMYDDDEEVGGWFFNTIGEAEKAMREYQWEDDKSTDNRAPREEWQGWKDHGGEG